MSRFEEGIVKAAVAFTATFREPPSTRELAQMVVFYDGMAICGYGPELEELRASASPEALVEAVLTAEGVRGGEEER